jgi:hypothetical protein
MIGAMTSGRAAQRLAATAGAATGAGAAGGHRDLRDVAIAGDRLLAQVRQQASLHR